jgi:hypothetical protein
VVDLTITQELAIATRAQMALGTPVPPTQMAETVVALFATRTAIAVTRHPPPSHSPTPNNIQLTATALRSETVNPQAFPEATSSTGSAALPLDTNEVDPLNLTATAIISGATQSTIALASNPELALTPTATRTPAPCQLSIIWNRPQSVNEIKAAFEESGVPIDTVEIIIKGIGQAEHCNAPFYPLNGQIAIGVSVEDLSDEAHLIILISDMLAVLSRFPPSEDIYGPEPARLFIGFHIGDVYRMVETDYSNALSAYNEGLRGAALVEALGGLLPPFRFPDVD